MLKLLLFPSVPVNSILSLSFVLMSVCLLFIEVAGSVDFLVYISSEMFSKYPDLPSKLYNFLIPGIENILCFWCGGPTNFWTFYYEPTFL